MYANLHLLGKGSFQNGEYWTSTEVDAWDAYTMHFGDGVHQGHPKDGDIPDIRPVRQFQSSAGDYSVGDKGPFGGNIFYVQTSFNPDYEDYLEAAPRDLTNNEWSTLFGDLLGTTESTVFTGYTNSLKIIGQTGHSDSAALDCLNAEFPSNSASPSASAS